MFDQKMRNRNCIFCAAQLTGKKSREHVFPLWMQDRWGLSDEGLLQTHFSETGEVLSSRHHDLRSHVCGGVCAPCNNGWMSTLETDAKPTVISLAEGQSTLSALTSGQSLILARWACKTAFALHAAANYRPIVPQNHFHSIRSDPTGLPLRVYVHARQHQHTQPFAWWQGPTWHVQAEEDVLTPEIDRVLRAQAYKICFSVKDLILIVSHNPFPNMLPVLWKWNHFPVYPERGPVFWFERDGFPEEDTQSACIALMLSMGLKQTEDRTSEIQRPR